MEIEQQLFLRPFHELYNEDKLNSILKKKPRLSKKDREALEQGAISPTISEWWELLLSILLGEISIPKV